jgi:uncharacterized protein DUF397
MTGWVKSSYSFSNGNCVEVADGDGGVGVRDSRDPAGPVLAAAAAAWTEFLARVRQDMTGSGDGY